MHILGLTGGVACGKSTVAALLAGYGAEVFDADRIGRQVLEEPAVRDALCARWGAAVLGADGLPNRAAVAEIVFAAGPAAAAQRQFLEDLIHPRIRARIEAGIRRLPDAAVPAVVIDAPLLVESGWNDVCSLTVFVDAPRELRRQRAILRGWTAEEFARREAAQLPIEEKRRWCQAVIDNSGDRAALERQVDAFWRTAVAPPSERFLE